MNGTRARTVPAAPETDNGAIMRKSEVEAGLNALAKEVAEAKAALARGDDEIGLENVGPRIERLVAAAMNLPGDGSRQMEPLLTKVRDDLQELSDALGAAIEEANAEAAAEKSGSEDEPPTSETKH
ncbi:hypothetical protein KAJ83_08355 [Marivibrio halodurans]|uniref:Uncharacterized protein n=1 Tax=Marivibrio halodurans TaxID=2039722 RepID=A0A8J7S7K2_9PROT|nr:hypothetical protein [Marivibrio halodurans]MBP5857017.1 hypothetical protein [Marivibrio halodurans]